MPNATPQKMSLHIPQATPTRDRGHPRSDATSSAYSSPTITRTAPPPGSSPNPSSAAPSAAPISADVFLSQHASSPNPPMAALEAVAADRNTLAAQNAQLWKLIEKQRTGYSQLMKEIERVRGERDVFRSNLQRVGENTDALLKAHREKERREGKESLRTGQPLNTILLTPATPGVSSAVVKSSAADHGHSNAASPVTLSRESRISLPEEAKRYYAAMGESPGASPRSEQGPNIDAPAVGTAATIAAASISESPPNGQSSGLAYAESVEDGGQFLEIEDGDSTTAGDQTTEQSGDEDEDEDDEDEDGDEDPLIPPGGTRAVVEEFPLPPQSPPVDSLTQAQMQSIAMQRMQEQRMTDDAQSQYSVTTDSHTLVELRPSHLSTMPVSPVPMSHGDPQMKFRALPLLASDLARTQISISHSSIRANDRGREVLSFVIVVRPTGKEAWKVEKLYSDVVTLDTRVRAVLGKSLTKKLANLPEGRLWKDHAPAKADQRKNALEVYLKSLIALPVKNKDEIIAFFTSDVVREAHKPISQAGYKEGYLTKRGKNFGGWKTRYFMLQGPSLEYYESRGGTHLGSILITGAQIGRQQKPQDKQQSDEDNEYRHAFLIIEARKGPGGSNPRHVLCAQSDRERDDWVEELVRYVTGTYNDEDGSIQDEPPAQPLPVTGRSSTSSDLPVTPSRRPPLSKDDIVVGSAVPIAQIPPDPVKTSAPSYVEHRAAAVGIETPLSTSLPSSSPLAGAEDVDVYAAFSQRATSEMGHYPDLVDQRAAFPKVKSGRTSPDPSRRRDKRRSLNPLRSTAIAERDDSPEKDSDPHTPRVDAHGKVKISGPMNGTPIPAGYKFGGKDGPPDPSSVSERREKAKSRTFWGFGRHEKANMPALPPRNVFGVSLEESLDVAEIASLPAIVFRCIQYLEAKKADQEEGIYRLSGSSAVIKALKDRFNLEGDLDLLASDEYWDPHAIAGLLKTFLRELPASILTRDLHLHFVDPQERISELSHLIASLPVTNYSLLRALTAHLILIVQNSNVNKMTMRNVGIVFSPTLGIPAGVFSLMLGEFKRVFNVDGTLEAEEVKGNVDDGEAAAAAELSRRNSRHYSDAAADKLLGLSGRALSASAESDEGGDVSLPDDSGTEETTEQDSVADFSATSSNVYVLQQAGVFSVCLTVDYRVLFVPLQEEAVRDGLEFYTTFFHSPPAIKALLHAVMGVGLIGLVGKVHKWDESAMYFDGSSLGTCHFPPHSIVCFPFPFDLPSPPLRKTASFVFAIVVYISVGIPASRTIATPVPDVDTREDQVEALRILSAGNVIMAVCLGGVLVLQIGETYARHVEANEVARTIAADAAAAATEPKVESKKDQ
ncbi:hypothetical protein EUX98_g1815 [Antrodiella citrinella]|uniref:RhoGAP-domain-containing protein n=1 Tax=Antrodiella citrinella TaxID=2447956 RepID=A0A4S4N0K3_9APHY|nr:hypothetical protein EUX98_g1815 [Antrodiella citrinella]